MVKIGASVHRISRGSVHRFMRSVADLAIASRADSESLEIELGKLAAEYPVSNSSRILQLHDDRLTKCFDDPLVRRPAVPMNRWRDHPMSTLAAPFHRR